MENGMLARGQKITYESILADIRTFRADPMIGIGKFSADEELANHLFKRIKLAEPDKVAEMQVVATGSGGVVVSS